MEHHDGDWSACAHGHCTRSGWKPDDIQRRYDFDRIDDGSAVLRFSYSVRFRHGHYIESVDAANSSVAPVRSETRFDDLVAWRNV